MTDDEQLVVIVALVREVVGEDLVGAYPHGSAVLGGMLPTSDLDVLALTRRPMTRAQKERLVEALLRLSGLPNRHIELTVVVESDVRPWRYPPRRDFQYGDWLRGDFADPASAVWGAQDDPDVATLLQIVVRGNRALFGPPPREVFHDIPAEDVIQAMREGVAGLAPDAADNGDTRNMLLTLARMWATSETGEILRKDRAAEWALPRLPPELRPLLERARGAYLDGHHGEWDDFEPMLAPYFELVVREVTREKTS